MPLFLSNKTDISPIELERIQTYTEGMNVPAWILDFSQPKVVYCNQRGSIYINSNKEDTKGDAILNAALLKSGVSKFETESFFITEVRIEIDGEVRNLSINANKVSERYWVLSSLQNAIIDNENYDYKKRIFFCEADGSIIHTKRVNKHEILNKAVTLLDLFTPEVQTRVKAIFDNFKQKRLANTAYLKEIKVDFKGYRQVVNIEIVRPERETDLLVVIFREAHFENELMLEKSRAELAEEINEILKLEIEEHKKTQLKLDDTEFLTKNIFDSSLNLIITFDKNMLITEFNRKAENTTGYKRQEVIGKVIDEILENAGDVENVMKVVNTTGSYEGELFCKRQNGERFSVFAGVTLLKNREGERLGYVCSMRDSTELKEWQLKFAITEERYTDLFENATDLIQGVTVKGEFIYTNKAWYKALGYSKKDRADLNIIDIVDEKDKKAFERYFHQIATGAKAVVKRWHLRKKGGDFLIVESNSNLKLLDGKPYAVRSIMRDVTDAVKASQLAQEQGAKMAVIIETGKIMFWTINRAIKLTSFNKEYATTVEKLYGKKPVIDKSLEGSKDKFASEEYHNFWEKKYRKVFDTGESLFFQTKTTDLQGKTYYREIYLRPISIEENRVVEISGIAMDITDKKLNQQKIDQQSAKIQAIFDSTNHIIWSNKTTGEITSFNEVMKNELMKRYGLTINVGENARAMAKQINIESYLQWDKLIREIKSGKKIQFEVETKDLNQKKYIEEISISPIYNLGGEIEEMAGIAQNVTFKRVSEQKLREQTAKINAIFDSTAILIWTVDRNMRIVAYNKVFADQQFKHLGKETSIGTNFIELIKDYIKKSEYDDLKTYFKNAFNGKSQQFEGEIQSKAPNKNVWWENFLNPIYSENNEITEIACLAYDITEKKRVETQMIETIHEKEILLKEVHHRVKNNLQVISSILNLQTSYVKDENSLNILRESQNRIKSMSFIHESLYQTKDFAHIEFSDYILSLTRNLIHSYSISSDKIKLKPKLKRCFLSLDQAIPCGLIVNELVSNALKYAFENRNTGEIIITLEENKKKVKLVIADNGIGLPPGLDYENTESLGLQLVYTLAEQLDANIEVEIAKGTKYLIIFEKQ